MVIEIFIFLYFLYTLKYVYVVRKWVIFIWVYFIHTFYVFIISVLTLIYYWCRTNLIFDNTKGTFICLDQ